MVALELVIAGGAFLVLLFLGLGLYYSTKPNPQGDKPERQEERARAVPQRQPVDRRARMRLNAAENRQRVVADEDEDVEDEREQPNFTLPDGKIGAKKKAKLEAKAAKKSAREVEERIRKMKKEEEAEAEEERKRNAEKEALEEKLRLEAEKKEIEERERREYEEYLKMKAAFSVEGEGFDEETDETVGRNMIRDFIEYIEANKVVVIEDLASHFKMKTQAAIDRIAKFQNDGLLTGVVDDRGKFIYISRKELENVAKFIKQRGRVSIADLVESSNRLIDLTPIAT